ncbi:hypothetical protein [Pedobacter heparinus]|uniref:hypothetical protein n=1 Tax=Pedobacter heparinus TaxID=984 RepID=UPI00292FF0B6|nr:hypothetical protein [Pedobacter heparinus]
MKTQNNSRRAFLQKFLSAGLAIAAGSAGLASCNSESPKEGQAAKDATPKVGADTSASASTGSAPEDFKCGDYSNVSKEELAKRKKLGYEEHSSDPERECVKCNLFIPKGEEKTCGGCILFKGPVNKDGSCTYWVEQVS